MTTAEMETTLPTSAQRCFVRIDLATQIMRTFFNGSSYIGSSTPPLSQVDNWTISGWIQPASLTPGLTYAVFMGFDNGTAGNGYGFGLNGGNQLYGLFGGIGPFFGGYMFPSTNQWYQVVMLRSSGSTTIYVNGVSTTNGITTTPEIPTSFEIGSADGTRFFIGAVDDVRIYKNAIPGFIRGSAASPIQNQHGIMPRLISATATATWIVRRGLLATVTDGGCGYTNTPSIQIAGGGGNGATATAVVTNGVIVGITITDAGTRVTPIRPPFTSTLHWVC